MKALLALTILVAALPQTAPASEPLNKMIAGQSSNPTSENVSPEPKETFAQNTAGAPAMGEVPAASAASGADHPKTEVALACIFGMAPKGCETLFVGGAARLFQRVVWKNGPDPYFRTAKYAGLNDGGDGIWDVTLMHSEATYVISQPNQDGKIQQLSILQGPPNQQCDNEVPRGVVNLGRIRASCQVLFSSAS